MTANNAEQIASSNTPEDDYHTTDNGVHQLIERVIHACPVPPLVRRLADLAQNKIASIKEVAAAIASDPVVAAEVIRIATGRADERPHIKTIEDALVTIAPQESPYAGMSAAILVACVSEHALSSFFRQTSILAATIAQELARRVSSIPTERAFLCGLLSEIGALACVKVDALCFQTLWSECGGLPVRRAQLEIVEYGETTHELGRDLLARNGMPQDIADAVGTPLNEEIKEIGALPKITAFSRTVALELIRSNSDEHRRNFMDKLPKFGAYFDLELERDFIERVSAYTV
jgi:HD-like signal output (HDOD) protein